MKRRKYLEDIGIDRSHFPESWGNKKDRRRKKWKKQRKKYGFDEREIWSLNTTFFYWLYERIKMYKNTASKYVNLKFHTFDYKDKKYTQEEIINWLIKDLEFICKFICTGKDDKEYDKYMEEVKDLWFLVLPAMWW